jgi:hypothetical protein
LSVLAVELLPFGVAVPRDGPRPVASAIGDPLGADLGSRRILRTSPLTALPDIC